MNREEAPKFLVNSEHIYVQSNDFVAAHYKENMTFWEFVLIAKMCSMISPKDVDFKGYRIYLKDLLEFMDLPDSGNVYAYILEAAERLLEKRIVIHAKNEEGQPVEIDTHIVTGVEKLAKPQRGTALYITLTFMPQLRPYLLQLKDNFTKFDFRQYKFLRTGSSIRMYHILKQYMGRKQRHIEINLDELKAMLGIGNKYELFGHFKSRILDDAQARLAETTDIRFDYEVLKEGKKVAAIKFHIAENVPTQFETDPSVSSDRKVKKNAATDKSEVEKILGDEFGVSPKMIKKLAETYSPEAIDLAVKLTRKAIQLGKIKDSKAGYFIKALQEGYTDRVVGENPKPVQTEVSKKAQEQMQEEADKKAQIEARKKADYQREEQRILELIVTDEDLVRQALAHIVEFQLSSTYDATKALSENLQNPSFKAVFYLTIKKLRPTAF
jgi:plasmid replication initiation protein